MYHREKQIEDPAEYVTFCDHLNVWIRIKVTLPSRLRYWSVLHASVSNECLWAWHTNVNLKVKYLQVKIIIRLTKNISSSGKDTTDLQVPTLYVCKLWHFDCIDDRFFLLLSVAIQWNWCNSMQTAHSLHYCLVKKNSHKYDSHQAFHAAARLKGREKV